ncbi:hypothetical protein NLJ89_g4929 [Agrocybe chaxingu]|uniref:Cytochrome P450 n=1 Tax=Agrocybe chaxingu TaxID=84603 RepID=A0A9W8MXB4_9AGAR|nr:hypothetical protein NLJ89_g4929 [Agrocybe chaxingu]
MYGYDVKSFEDEFIEVAEKGQHLGNCLLVPGATLLNVIPILCRLPPIAGAARLAVYVRQLTEDMQRLPMEFAKNAMAAGVAKPSLVTSFLEKKAAGPTRELEEEEQAISKIAATVYSAAADTTIAAAMSFFFAMVTHPHVQKKAQQELDATIGTGRLPEYPDRESLPYLEAIYRTTVFSNIWAMTHEEAVYPEPSEFRPERHFTADGKLNKDDRILAYGFGRRLVLSMVCVGRHVASSTLWLMMASVLATFDIVKAKDALGSEIEVNSEYTDGLISQKKPFKCLFVPRSNQAIHLIQETTRTH